MRVYKVEFKGMERTFHDTATEDQIVELNFTDASTLRALKLNTSITLDNKKSIDGWDKYPRVTFTAHESQSYFCHCCKKEVPGDGCYDICHFCGWENEIGEGLNDAYGINNMTLREGQSNFAKYSWYQKPVNER